MSENAPYVVFVEDDPVMAEVTRFRLELLGFRVRVYATSDEAIRGIKDEMPDGVIVDLAFGGNGGLKFMETLGLDESTTRLPIMALSTDAELDTVQKAFRAGAVEYLVAPYNPLILESKVEQLTAASGKPI